LLGANCADALLRAASDGELRESRSNVTPPAQTIHEYIAAALSGREVGTMILVVQPHFRAIGASMVYTGR